MSRVFLVLLRNFETDLLDSTVLSSVGIALFGSQGRWRRLLRRRWLTGTTFCRFCYGGQKSAKVKHRALRDCWGVSQLTYNTWGWNSAMWNQKQTCQYFTDYSYIKWRALDGVHWSRCIPVPRRSCLHRYPLRKVLLVSVTTLGSAPPAGRWGQRGSAERLALPPLPAAPEHARAGPRVPPSPARVCCTARCSSLPALLEAA